MSEVKPNLRKSALQPLEVPAMTQEQEAVLQAQHLPGPPTLASDTGLPDLTSGADLAAEFQPTQAMHRVKTRFWSKWAAGAPVGSEPTLALAQKLTQSAALATWWKRAGFVEWFLNTEVTDERLAHLLHLSLSAAEEILLNTDPRAQSARVAMIKAVAEMSGKLKAGSQTLADPKKAAEQKQLEAVAGMTREQAIEVLKKGGMQVTHTVDVSPTTKVER